MEIPVNIAPGTLPFDCYPSPQVLNEAIINGAVATVDAVFTAVIKSEVEPGVDQQDYIWFSLIDLEYYMYINGNWVRKHPTAPGGSERRLWVGTEADLWSYDGGDGSNPGVTTPTGAVGAMWEVDTSFAAKFLIAPGTLPSTTVLVVGATGGVETHALTGAEMKGHWHGVGTDGNADDPAVMLHRDWTTVESYIRRFNDVQPTSAAGWADASAITTGVMGSTHALAEGGSVPSDAHTNMPPYKAVYVIKRTARTLIVA